MYSRIIGVLLIVIAVVIVATVACRNSHKGQQPVVFSSRSMLDGLWHSYKTEYLEPNTYRTLDKQRSNITTSEGESYTMLRAVWWDDKDIFDKSWKWTQDNLQRSSDHLFSWLFGARSDGSYGIVTNLGGQNSASDADTNIALALIFANGRWNDSKYLDSAKAIISDIWTNEVVVAGGKPYLAADNVEKGSQKSYYLVNLSYLSPAAYKIFAEYDSSHDWNGLASSSYDLISRASSAKLASASSSGLPPDWVGVDKSSGALVAPSDKKLDTNYGYDAMRVPFNLALDWQWFNDPRAQNDLANFSFLKEQWQSSQNLQDIYSHDGTILSANQAPAIYGGDIGYFVVADQPDAQNVYENKLKILYSPDTNSWKQKLSYYDDNWAWFGIALYNNFTINLDANAKK